MEELPPTSDLSQMPAEDRDELIFPTPPPDMPLRPAQVDPEALYRHIAALLPTVVNAPGFMERRLAEKCAVPFELD